MYGYFNDTKKRKRETKNWKADYLFQSGLLVLFSNVDILRLEKVVEIANNNLDAIESPNSNNALRQNFIKKTLILITRCLRDHYNGDNAAYLERFNGKIFPFSRYNKLCNARNICTQSQ